MSDHDPNLAEQVQRLYELSIYRRWLFVMLCWLTFGQYGLWQFRGDFDLWRDHFTWVALRYGLAFHMMAAFGIFFCIGMTGAVLVWQSSHILRGLSPREKLRLENEVKNIRELGPKHPLWKWIFHESGDRPN
jgi:hypothetical protein